MHRRTRDSPYESLVDALQQFPRTATAIAVRLAPARDEVELLAPVGLEDLFELRVRPTEHFQRHPDRYEERLAEKRWLATWPKLQIVQVDPLAKARSERDSEAANGESP